MTREQKILSAVLGVAALAVMTDRVVLGGASGPQSADAAISPSAGAGDANGNASTSKSQPLPELETFADVEERLIAALDRTRFNSDATSPANSNAFNPRGALAPLTRITEVIDPNADFEPHAFLRRHGVQAVITDDSGSSALIAGRTVGVGFVSEGMTLSEISERSVTWVGRGTRFRVPVGSGGPIR